MLKQVIITYGKGKADKFVTEHRHNNINRFAEKQAELRGTRVTGIQILHLDN